MNFDKATEDQLWVILKRDNDCPKELMEQVVDEAIKRNMFAHLVKHVIKKVVWNMREFLYKMNMAKDDLMQIGLIGVLNAQRNYRPSNQSFFTFAFMNIKSELLHLLEKSTSQKREHYSKTESIDKEISEGTTLESILPDQRNIERYVIEKTTYEGYLAGMNEVERRVFKLFVAGYSFNEMAKGMVPGITTAAGLTKHFHKATKKINPALKEKLNLKELGLYTRTKVTA